MSFECIDLVLRKDQPADIDLGATREEMITKDMGVDVIPREKTSTHLMFNVNTQFMLQSITCSIPNTFLLQKLLKNQYLF